MLNAFYIWLAVSTIVRVVVFSAILNQDNQLHLDVIKTAESRYLFLGMILPVIGDVVIIMALIYYGMKWASEGD